MRGPKNDSISVGFGFAEPLWEASLTRPKRQLGLPQSDGERPASEGGPYSHGMTQEAV
jgi:hypothetical protein